MLVSEKLSSSGIARELNRQHVAYIGASEWNIHRVNAVLTTPKYTGCHVYGRTSVRLSTPRVKLPRSEWVLTPGAFEPIVDPSVFSVPDKEQCVKLYTNLKCEEKQKVKGQRADSVVAGGEAVLGKAVNDTVQTFMPANAHHAVAQRHSRPKAPHLDDGLAFPRIEIFERLQAAIEGYEIMAPLGLKGHHLFN